MAQANLFKRASVIIRSNVSELLSKYEDPVKEIDIIIYDMRKDLAELKKKSAIPFGEEGRAKNKLENLRRDAEEWQFAATNAAKAGDDADARKCFDNYQAAKRKADNQQAIYDKLVETNKGLREQIQTIIDEISAMESKAGEIKAMSAAATATQTAAEIKSGFSSGANRDLFDRMEAKAAGQLEAAKANAEFEFGGNKSEDEDLKAKYSAGVGDADFQEFLASVRK